jgi:hypothetical protein
MEQPELVLARVLTGHLTPDQAAEQLSAFVTLDLDGQQQTAVYARPFPGRAKLEPTDVAYTLRRYLSGIVSEDELRRWATFVTSLMAMRHLNIHRTRTTTIPCGMSFTISPHPGFSER